MHIRRTFLQALRMQLKTLLGYGGVWIQRSAPRRETYPAITLFSDSETVEIMSVHTPARPQERSLTITVIVWLKGGPDFEKAEADMDGFALDIEQTVKLPAGADDIYLVSTEFQFAEDEPDIHAVSLTYKLDYNTVEFNPT